MLGANTKRNTTLNWDFQPYQMADLPTLETGASTNDDVEVKAGDMVLDADGNLVELAAGMKVHQRRGRDRGIHRRSDHDEADDRQLHVPR